MDRGQAEICLQKCPFSLRWDPGSSYLIHNSLVTRESAFQTTSRSVQPFLQGSRSCNRGNRHTHTDRQTMPRQDRSSNLVRISIVLPCGLKCNVVSVSGSVAEWLACWTQRRRRPGFKSLSRRCRVTVLGKLFTPIVPLFTEAAKLVAALLRVAGVTAGLAESNGSLSSGL